MLLDREIFTKYGDDVRVYAALSLAAMYLANFYHMNKQEISPSTKPPKTAKMTMMGKNDVSMLADVYFAIMLLTKNSKLKFSEDNIQIGPSIKDEFKKELKKSERKELFKKVLAERLKETKLDPLEREKILGHMVPADKLTIYQEKEVPVDAMVRCYGSISMIHKFFEIETDSVTKRRNASLKPGKSTTSSMVFTGPVKLGDMLRICNFIDSVNLNFLDAIKRFGVDGCKQIFSGCVHVDEISFVNNDLAQCSLSELQSLLACIPANVKKINLAGNGLEKFSAQDLVSIADAIPITVEKAMFVWEKGKSPDLLKLDRIETYRNERAANHAEQLKQEKKATVNALTKGPGLFAMSGKAAVADTSTPSSTATYGSTTTHGK